MRSTASICSSALRVRFPCTHDQPRGPGVVTLHLAETRRAQTGFQLTGRKRVDPVEPAAHAGAKRGDSPIGSAERGQGEAPSGLEDPMHFAERTLHVRKEVQCTAAVHEVEMLRSEGKAKLR